MRPRFGVLANPNVLVSACAGLSRILGFLRDVLVAAVLGSGPAADAFVVAFRIPGLIRRVLGEGALNGSVIPIESRIRHERGPDAAQTFAQQALLTAGLALLALTALAELAAPLVVLGLASGYGDDPLRLALATSYTRLMLPLIAATTLAALAAAFLNAHGRFALAALAPLLVNGVLVVVLAALASAGIEPERAGWALAAAMPVAGLLHALTLLIAVKRLGFPLRIGWPAWSPDLRKAFVLAGPGLMTVLAGQLSIVVATQAASQVPSGVARLYYADRVFQLPLGFVAASAGVVLLPELVRLGHAAQISTALNRALGWALYLVCPAALALVLLGQPIVSVLFARGEFGAADTVETARALTILALGLPLAAIVRLMTQPFLAREATRVPLLASAAGIAVTAIAAFALASRFGIAGIASGVTLGGLVHALVLVGAAMRLGLWRPDAELLRRCAGIILATLGMGLSVSWLAGWLEGHLAVAANTVVRFAALSALCLSGLAVYGALSLVTGAASLTDLRRAP